MEDGQPVQTVAPFQPLTLLVTDLHELPVGRRDARLRQLADLEANRPFDMGHQPLFRASVVRLAPDDHVFLVTFHHAIFDGWSYQVFLSELAALYGSSLEKRPSPLAPLPIQYGDFAVWQRELMRAPAALEHLVYWEKKLSGCPLVLRLPADRPRPPVQSCRGARFARRIPAPVCAALKELSQREDATLFMTVFAGYCTLVHRHTAQEDILVGVPIAGRTCAETERLIGCCANTLVLRADLSGDPTVRELLRRVRQLALEGFAHQDAPFETVLERLDPVRDPSRTRLFQGLFQLRNIPRIVPEWQELTVEPLAAGTHSAKVDLSFEVEEQADGLMCDCEYSTDLFDEATISRMIERFEVILGGMAWKPTARLSELDWLTDLDRRQVVVDWNKTAAEFPSDRRIHDLFADHAARTPGAAAVVCCGQRTTYADLDDMAEKAAASFRTQGVDRDALVAICLEQSVQRLAALLGTLKAGGAFLTLDPTLPEGRKRVVLEEAGFPVVLTSKEGLRQLTAYPGKTLCIDELFLSPSRLHMGAETQSVTSGELAYVIFTSGSTGRPKGVMVEHGSLVNYIIALGRKVAIRPADRVLQMASLTFDTSIEETFLALAHGATLVLRNDEMLYSPRVFLETCVEWKITILDLPTVFWHELAQSLGQDGLRLPPSVRLVIIGGEQARRDRWLQWRTSAGERVQLLNGYGPTEGTIVATWQDLMKPEDGASSSEGLPIGRPVPNVSAYVLDRAGKPVAPGVWGELYLGGAGVARGYLNQPALTAERFVADPFVTAPDARMYRTGDVCRWRLDGRLELNGRMDRQVKVRGYRIELEEIESTLCQCSEIEQAVVVAREDTAGDKRLVAYVICKARGPFRAKSLRATLLRRLPDHMVPYVFVPLERFPLTPHGKVDRAALPPPEMHEGEEPASARSPHSLLEFRLMRLWENVLKRAVVGPDDDFFEMGGHSLLGLRLIAELEKLLDREVPVSTLFHGPTPTQMARLLHDGGWAPSWSALVPLKAGGARAPLFLVHDCVGEVYCYLELAGLLSSDQPVYGVRAVGVDSGMLVHRSVEQMAAHYLAEIRSLQPEGPYFIGGSAVGGLVALEIAQRLRREGAKVAFLGIFETRPRNLPLWRSASGRRGIRWSRFWWRLRSLFAALKRAGAVRAIPNPALDGNPDAPSPSGGISVATEPTEAVRQTLLTAHFDYQPEPYPDPINVFWSEGQACRLDLAWGRLATRGLTVHRVPGNHSSMWRGENAKALAKRIEASQGWIICAPPASVPARCTCGSGRR